MGERLLQIVAAIIHCTTDNFSILEGTPTWRLHTKLYKFGYIVFPNISQMKYHTDLTFDEAFCIFIFFYFPDSGHSVLNGLHFYF